MPETETHPLPRILRGVAILLCIYAFVVYVVPRPDAVTPAGWRLLGLFVATVAGLILQPVPGGAVVLTAVVLASVAGGLTISQALSGYSDSTVWLVMAAFFISRSLDQYRPCTPNRVCFSSGCSDEVRSASVTRSRCPTCCWRRSSLRTAHVPAASSCRSSRSIAELYGSRPGATARSTRLVSHDRGLPMHLHLGRHVLYGPGE